MDDKTSTEVRRLTFAHGGLAAEVAVGPDGGPRLLALRPAEGERSGVALPAAWDSHYMFYLQGEQAGARYLCDMGLKHHLGLPGKDLLYVRHSESRTGIGLLVEWHLAGEGLEAVLYWQFHDKIPVLRAWMEVRNTGDRDHVIEAIAPIQLNGLTGHRATRDWPGLVLHLPHNGWCNELQWRGATLSARGLTWCRQQSSNRIFVGNTGTWSTKEHLPMAVLEDRVAGTALYWQIEHNGSWGWELSDMNHDAYLTLGLLDEEAHHWTRRLRPGESCVSLPVAVGCVRGGFDAALGALTRHRRALRRPHRDNRELPVIFNDYMNCLFADPTSEKERPLIAAAAAAGCEIYVIDAAWYAPRGAGWWSSVGEWQPSPDRFEGGIRGILGEIRAAGMVPGLWLEIESMGVDCPLASEWPDACFFMRHGKRVATRGRLQLDFRHPVVVAHANEVVDRMVREYGVGYIKMDYNIDTGIGTEVDADSFGDGLLRHNRAYLDWLDAVFDRHPDLVIENCGSGGLRMDYALLARHSIQSSSDQEDFRLTGRIAAAVATGAAPEQQALWAYPLAAHSREEVAYNMVSGLLARMHLSGQLAGLGPEAAGLVREAVSLYKCIRKSHPHALPFWPLGPPQPDDPFWCCGLRGPDGVWLAVWKPGDAPVRARIPMPEGIVPARVLYPSFAAEAIPPGPVVQLDLPAGPCARLLGSR
ncbi:MAG: glycoside hydrolase family 36 protein [Oceanipulchritudo sp.]